MSDVYEVLITRPVVEDLATQPVRVRKLFFNAVDRLGRFPEIGHEYVAEPYEDELPFPCREYHLPHTSKTIYYVTEGLAGSVKVFALVDQRRNPAYRFRGIDDSRLEDF